MRRSAPTASFWCGPWAGFEVAVVARAGCRLRLVEKRQAGRRPDRARSLSSGWRKPDPGALLVSDVVRPAPSAEALEIRALSSAGGSWWSSVRSRKRG